MNIRIFFARCYVETMIHTFEILKMEQYEDITLKQLPNRIIKAKEGDLESQRRLWDYWRTHFDSNPKREPPFILCQFIDWFITQMFYENKKPHQVLPFFNKLSPDRGSSLDEIECDKERKFIIIELMIELRKKRKNYYLLESMPSQEFNNILKYNNAYMFIKKPLGLYYFEGLNREPLLVDKIKLRKLLKISFINENAPLQSILDENLLEQFTEIVRENKSHPKSQIRYDAAVETVEEILKGNCEGGISKSSIERIYNEYLELASNNHLDPIY